MLAVALAQGRLPSAEAVIRALAARLAGAGAVLETFADAVLARESASPTGIPLPSGAVAMPHADPEHVLVPAVAAATLCAPVDFRQMGSPEIALPVSLVVVLAFTKRDDAQGALVRLLRALATPEARERLAAAAHDDALARALEDLWKS
jgi:PTS system galactitol-specific IIA component